MGSRWMGLGVFGLMTLLSVGCQNKVAQENRDLRGQTRELQAQLDEAHRQQAMRDQSAHLTPAPTPPVVVTPPPVAPVTPIKQPDLAGLDTRVDPVAGTTTVTLPGDVFFDPGKAELKTSAKPSLDKVAAALKKEYGGKTVKVEGYTDTDPIKHSKWKSNQELSEARAAAVRDYLVNKGVGTERLTIEGLGETKPKGTKAASRRVEVVVITR